LVFRIDSPRNSFWGNEPSCYPAARWFARAGSADGLRYTHGYEFVNTAYCRAAKLRLAISRFGSFFNALSKKSGAAFILP
jgi:hypothetical protein